MIVRCHVSQGSDACIDNDTHVDIFIAADADSPTEISMGIPNATIIVIWFIELHRRLRFSYEISNEDGEASLTLFTSNWITNCIYDGNGYFPLMR